MASLFVIGSEIYELSTATHELVDQISWSNAQASGFGGVESVVLNEVETGIFYGAYTTADPVLEKGMSGILRLDLKAKSFESFELGPALAISVFALSPDGKRGFGGLGDMVVIDMETKRIIERKEAFERGRQNNTIIVSADGVEIYVTGVGDAMKVYDARAATGHRCRRRSHEPALPASSERCPVSAGKSVRNMCPGAWLTMSSGLARSATACGVTPHAQNTGTSLGRISTASP